MKKNRLENLVAIIMALVMLLSAMSFAEELGEVDLYAPEIYEGEVALEAPANEPEQALERDAQSVEEGATIEEMLILEAPVSLEAALGETLSTGETFMSGEAPVAELTDGAEYAVAAPECIEEMDGSEQAVMAPGSCNHTNMVNDVYLDDVVFEKYTRSDRYHHTYTVGSIGTVILRCCDCDQVLYQNNIDTPVYFQYQEFCSFVYNKKAKKCNYCGQKTSKCNHKNSHSAGTERKWYSYLNASNHVCDSSHVDPETGIVAVRVCDNCGIEGLQYDDGKINWNAEAEFSTFFENDPVVIQPHNYVNGVCTGCGYMVMPANVSFNEANVALGVKDKHQLATMVSPADAAGNITYSSSNAKIVSVVASTGAITAKKAGTATIYANFNGIPLASSTVTVYSAPKKVTLNAKKATLYIGDGYQLTATLSANSRSTLTWSTNKAGVATVDANGYVSAVGKGTATITVKTANGKKATCKVTVKDPYEPSGVSITQGKKVTLNVGETLQLSAALSPATAQSGLTWKSSKSKVATVDSNGLVTAVSKGTATITVMTRNGKKATCKVTVKSEKQEKETMELIEYLTSPNGVNKLIRELKPKKYKGSGWEGGRTYIGAGEEYGEYLRNNEIELEDYVYGYDITIYSASNGKYSLDGINTTMNIEESIAVLTSKGWQLEYYPDEEMTQYGFEKEINGIDNTIFIRIKANSNIQYIMGKRWYGTNDSAP